MEIREKTCFSWSSILYLSGPTWVWTFLSKSTSMISESNLSELDGRPDRSCRRCLPFDKPFTWKKFEIGRGKTDSILLVSLADLISTIRCLRSSSVPFPSTWQLTIVISGSSKTIKSKPLISSVPTWKHKPTSLHQDQHTDSKAKQDSKQEPSTNLNRKRIWRCTLYIRTSHNIPFSDFDSIDSIRQ